MAKTVLIECPIRREGGSTTQMWPTDHSPEGQFYHFKPSPSDPRHVAQVSDPAHLRRFLEIGYELVDDDPPAATRGIGKAGEAVDGGVAASPAQEDEAAGPQAEEPGAPADAPAPAISEDALSQMPIAELRKLHIKVVGKKPGPKHGRDLIISRILAQVAAR